MVYRAGKRIPIGFPPDIEKKISVLSNEYRNSFAGTVLWIISDWFKRSGEWSKIATAPEKTENDFELVSDAYRRGKKILVRSLPDGKFVPLEDYLKAHESKAKGV